MNFLIVYGTTEGQSRKIARFMGDVLREAGHHATVCDASENPPPPDAFDAVIAGGSIHIGKYQSALTHFITHHVSLLNKKPGAFFSVCLAIASDDAEEHQAAQRIMDEYLEQTGWKTRMRTQVAGALLYTQYDFFKRLIMKQISKKEGRTTDTSRDYEYTDWDAVRKFVIDFAGSNGRK